MLISLYSLLLTVSLTIASPWWLYRMLTSHRYRAGLPQRLGRVPPTLRSAAEGKNVIWLHAVSVGEFLAAQRLITDLSAALGPEYLIAISTTTATAQKLARERLPSQKVILSEGSAANAAEESPRSSPTSAADTFSTANTRVFYFPLDFAFAVRPYLRALQPHLIILMESELWPRLLHECAAARIPVVVANARVSDRSFRRTYPFRSVWLRVARHVSLFLAQSHETATRLEQLGIPPTRIQTPGNLKYDPEPPPISEVARWVGEIAAGRPIIVAGSTLSAAKPSSLNEEEMLIQAWESRLRKQGALLVLAPRHPDRFDEVAVTALEFRDLRASQLRAIRNTTLPPPGPETEIILLDTLGNLASVYALASVAFIGGSLVPRGGHNPLEAARFGVPILMGPSYENFREMVDGMLAANAIRITSQEALVDDLTNLLRNDHGLGERAQRFFSSQSGATARTISALLPLLKEPQP